jgi:hypothetical protein
VSHSESYTDTGPTSAFYQGVDAERERIVKLAEKRICFDHKNGCYHSSCYALYELLELIREQKENESLDILREGENK